MTIAVSAAEGVTLVPLTRAQYEALVGTGALEGIPVELLEGALVEMAPQGPWHSDLIEVLARFLARRVLDDLGVPASVAFRGRRPVRA